MSVALDFWISTLIQTGHIKLEGLHCTVWKAKTKVWPECDYGAFFGVSSSPLLMREDGHRPDCVWVFCEKQLAAQVVPVADLCWSNCRCWATAGEADAAQSQSNSEQVIVQCRLGDHMVNFRQFYTHRLSHILQLQRVRPASLRFHDHV